MALMLGQQMKLTSVDGWRNMPSPIFYIKLTIDENFVYFVPEIKVTTTLL